MSLKPLPLDQKPSHPQLQPNDEDDDFNLTIRFSASLPDLLLSISGSLNANTATLKQLIRSHIPAEYAKNRIRLIHAGKALVDDVPLHAALKRSVSKPPSRIGTPGPYDDSLKAANGSATTKALKAAAVAAATTAQDNGKGKGKQPLREPVASQARIYVHCSIGDIVLSAQDLADEAATAAAAAAVAAEDHDETTETERLLRSNAAATAPTTTTTPAPRGFDRLLIAGFTSAEVQSLRLQFLAIQAHTHTPDTMPSPSTLRDMEDRWLDNSSSSNGLFPTADSATAGEGATADDMQAGAGALDDMIFGTAMGFFWPVGCLMWGVREEGIWSQRRKMAVIVGFLLNMGLGMIRVTGG